MNALLGSLMLWPLEQAVNGLLRSDPHLQSQMSQFAGRCLCVRTSQPSLVLTLRFADSGVSLSGIEPESLGIPADATLEGDAIELLQLLSSDPQRRALANPSIRLDGDVHFVQDLYMTLQRLDLDFQDLLQPIIGDMLSNELGRLQGKSRDFLRDSRLRLQRSLDDYLKEELRWTPARAQREDFLFELERLKLGLDRVEARMALAQRQLGEVSG